MLNIEKQIAYWKKGAEEEMELAEFLLEKDKVRHALFFAHLALEKALKAHVCKQTQDAAPRIHNLVRLCEMARLEPAEDRMDSLAEINSFGLEGRYPDLFQVAPSFDDAPRFVQRARETFEWLMQRL